MAMQDAMILEPYIVKLDEHYKVLPCHAKAQYAFVMNNGHQKRRILNSSQIKLKIKNELKRLQH